MVRVPVHLVAVCLSQLRLYFLDVDEPGWDCVVEQARAAAPAVRHRVRERFALEQAAVLFKFFHDEGLALAVVLASQKLWCYVVEQSVLRDHWHNWQPNA